MTSFLRWLAVPILPALLCCCATQKPTAPSVPAKTALGKRTSSPVQFGFLPGVDWQNATPDQIADAVFNAVTSNPDAAADIAVAGVQKATRTGRWPIPDGKQSVDPEPGFWSFQWLLPKRSR